MENAWSEIHVATWIFQYFRWKRMTSHALAWLPEVNFCSYFRSIKMELNQKLIFNKKKIFSEENLRQINFCSTSPTFNQSIVVPHENITPNKQPATDGDRKASLIIPEVYWTSFQPKLKSGHVLSATLHLWRRWSVSVYHRCDYTTIFRST